jgi:arsenate reductase-like glutaredoxin family protein
LAELTFYEKPTCTTCKKTAKLLAERGDRAVLARPPERVLELLD